MGKLHTERLDTDKTSTTGALRFFSYLPTHREAGQAILTEIEKYCSQLGVKTISVCYPAGYYRYRLDGHRLSSAMLHVLALLGTNDYQIQPVYFFMHRQLLVEGLAEPALPGSHIRVEVIKNHIKQNNLPDSQPHLYLYLWQGKKRIGLCQNALGSVLSQQPVIRHSAYVQWIKIEPEARQHGLGAYLLQRTLFELQNLGCRNVYADVRCKNYAAQMLHIQAGYQVIHCKYSASKLLNNSMPVT